MCWCLSENIAKQQQLAASPPQSKVRVSPVAAAPAAWLPRRGPDPAASSLGPVSAQDLHLDRELLAGRLCLHVSAPWHLTGLLTGFHVAQAEWQSQTEHDPSMLCSVLWFAHGRV